MTADIVLIAPPGGRRARAFAATVEELGLAPPRVAAPLDVLRGDVHLADLVRPGSVVRLDSPGEDIATEEALIRLGGAEPGDLAGGELAPMRAWYAGLDLFLDRVDAQLALAPAHRRMQRSGHIRTMFDKAATHARLTAAGVPVPEALPEVASADELLEQAAARGWSQVFVKLAYGSSASGAVALRWSGRRVCAETTVRMEGGRLYNSRRLVRYETWPEVQALLDALAPHRLHVERWLPKASFAGRTVDLRVVVIGARAQHTLVRAASGPITNLHLGNARGDVDALRAAAGPATWARVQRVAEAALAAFPGALYGGVDVLLTPGFRAVAVLEVNAFGDYHRGVRVDGFDTYGAQLRALLEGVPC